MKMKATETKDNRQSSSSWKQQTMYHKSFHLLAWNRCSKAEASLTRLHPTVLMLLDDNLEE